MEFNIKINEQMVAEVANRVLDEFEYNGKTIREWADTLTHPKSNADRIRAMTEGELAEFLDLVRGNKDYPLYYTDWLDWLKQEAKDA